MRVSVFYFDGCPNWQVAQERLRAALVLVGRPDEDDAILTAAYALTAAHALDTAP